MFLLKLLVSMLMGTVKITYTLMTFYLKDLEEKGNTLWGKPPEKQIFKRTYRNWAYSLVISIFQKLILPYALFQRLMIISLLGCPPTLEPSCSPEMFVSSWAGRVTLPVSLILLQQESMTTE